MCIQVLDESRCKPCFATICHQLINEEIHRKVDLVSIVNIKFVLDIDVPNTIGNKSKFAFCLQKSSWCFMHLVSIKPVFFVI